jgi:cytoskeletal protein CcmA (bactofilin family)
MALQQINWLQIDTTRIPSGSEITLGGSGSNYLEAVYVKGLHISGSTTVSGSFNTDGDVIVGGNLTVKGTTTTVDSTTISLGDNILSLNGSNGAFGGIQVNDPTNPSKISGSLLWDSVNDYWVAGPSGSEDRVVLASDLTSLSSSLNSSNIWFETSSFYATTHDLQVTGSMIIKGNLRVEGTTTLVQTIDSAAESLIVSGAMSIVKNQIGAQIKSASLSIQNLGILGDRSQNYVIDCGDGFF